MQRLLRSPFGIFGVGVLTVAVLVVVLMPGLLHTLVSKGYFMPHRHCYLDNAGMIWLQGLSDFSIGLSYMVISGALAFLVWKARKDLPFQWMFLAFGAFIFGCGWTHFMEVVTLWYPSYWLSGTIKAITAAISMATGVGVFYLLPHVFKLIQTAKASEQRRLELIKVNRELEEAYQDLTTFSYTLSHDIRAPLRAVRGFSSAVLEDYHEKLEGEGTVMLGKVLHASDRLDRIVDDVLALSRLSRTPVRTESIDVEQLLREIIRGRADLQSPNAELRIRQPLLPVWGDEASLRQCLDNLLGNAVKFVAPLVKPQVEIYTEAKDDKVRLWVVDNGIGISRENQQKIFEPFQRLHAQESYEGAGLGLAIVKKAVERMNGQVGVESEPGQGSRFWVELQCADAGVPVGD